MRTDDFFLFTEKRISLTACSFYGCAELVHILVGSNCAVSAENKAAASKIVNDAVDFGFDLFFAAVGEHSSAVLKSAEDALIGEKLASLFKREAGLVYAPVYNIGVFIHACIALHIQGTLADVEYAISAGILDSLHDAHVEGLDNGFKFLIGEIAGLAAERGNIHGINARLYVSASELTENIANTLKLRNGFGFIFAQEGAEHFTASLIGYTACLNGMDTGSGHCMKGAACEHIVTAAVQYAAGEVELLLHKTGLYGIRTDGCIVINSLYVVVRMEQILVHYLNYVGIRLLKIVQMCLYACVSGLLVFRKMEAELRGDLVVLLKFNSGDYSFFLCHFCIYLSGIISSQYPSGSSIKYTPMSGFSKHTQPISLCFLNAASKSSTRKAR